MAPAHSYDISFKNAQQKSTPKANHLKCTFRTLLRVGARFHRGFNEKVPHDKIKVVARPARTQNVIHVLFVI